MLLLMLVYLLLAMEIRVYAGTAVCGLRGSAYIEAGALGVSVRIDGRIDMEKRVFCMNGGRQIALKRRGKRHRDMLRVFRAGRFEAVTVRMRLGLGDASETAVSAGSVRAALLASLAGLGIPARISIVPDFSEPGFALAAQGIYSFRMGDIILAAARAAWKRKRKEGFGWKSIPLRA